MKPHHLLVGALVSFGFTVANAACVPPYADPTTCLGGARTAVTGIKNIGYYISPTAAGSQYRGDYVAEIGNANNLVVAMYDVSNTNAIDTLLPKLATSGVKLSLIVNSIFLDANANSLSDIAISNNINTLYAKVSAYLGSFHSLAIDEAMLVTQWNKVCKPAGTAIQQCFIDGPSPATVALTVYNLEKWAAMMRGTFLNTSFAYNESGAMIRTATALPKNWDLYGFDCYGDWNNCVDTGASMSSLFSNLKSQVVALNNTYGGYRRMVVVGETTAAFDRVRTRPSPISGSALGDVIIPNNPALGASALINDANLWGIAQNWKGLAATDPMVNTFVGFAWDTVWEGPLVWLGLRGFPYTLGQMEAWGRAVSGKSTANPTSAPVIDFGVSPNMAINTGGPIWAWSTYNGSTCRSVTEPDTYPALPASGSYWFQSESTPRSLNYTIECSNPYGVSQRTINYTVVGPQQTTMPVSCKINPSICR